MKYEENNNFQNVQQFRHTDQRDTKSRVLNNTKLHERKVNEHQLQQQ